MTNISQNNELKDWIKKKFITYIKWNDLVGKSPVGSGHFGVVYKTHWNSMNKDVVRKSPFLENNDAIQNEIQILASNRDERPIIQHVYSVLENMLEKLYKSVEKDSEDIKGRY
ncbi:2120_t:CDS:2 [Funneliformis caledonium]|uniref:2120_t:CDS:1 n=1 Tax=Funneliformis caledonium TaxID=1117310 RepID=A0A9N9D2W3_9GLOM|nr:2120_t:CDS:2 [Funneliformis caledonium]